VLKQEDLLEVQPPHVQPQSGGERVEVEIEIGREVTQVRRTVRIARRQ
jgi:hypothetical protein